MIFKLGLLLIVLALLTTTVGSQIHRRFGRVWYERALTTSAVLMILGVVLWLVSVVALLWKVMP